MTEFRKDYVKPTNLFTQDDDRRSIVATVEKTLWDVGAERSKSLEAIANLVRQDILDAEGVRFPGSIHFLSKTDGAVGGQPSLVKIGTAEENIHIRNLGWGPDSVERSYEFLVGDEKKTFFNVTVTYPLVRVEEQVGGESLIYLPIKELGQGIFAVSYTPIKSAE